MEHKHKILSADTDAELIEAFIAENCAVPLVVSGNSMIPFLKDGRDTVYLYSVTDSLKRGDIVFYKRDNGAYVLHRICKINGDTYSLVGDAQSFIEHGIRRDQIVAVVTLVYRKGKYIGKRNLIWQFFAKIWIRMIKLRPWVLKTYTRFKR